MSKKTDLDGVFVHSDACRWEAKECDAKKRKRFKLKKSIACLPNAVYAMHVYSP
jgi:hypothetical protein